MGRISISAVKIITDARKLTWLRAVCPDPWIMPLLGEVKETGIYLWQRKTECKLVAGWSSPGLRDPDATLVGQI